MKFVTCDGTGPGDYDNLEEMCVKIFPLSPFYLEFNLHEDYLELVQDELIWVKLP